MTPSEPPPEPFVVPADSQTAPEPVGAEELKLRYFWRNLTANLLAEVGWGFGWATCSLVTVLPVFLRKLGAEAQVIGLLPAISMLGFAALQLPASYFVAPFHRKKNAFILAHIPAALSWLPLALVTLALAGSRPRAAMVAFLILYAAFALAMGPVLPMWSDFLNRLLPAQRRGRAWGLITAAGCTAGVGAAVVIARVVGTWQFPRDYAFCFLLTFISFSLGTAVLVWVHEPVISQPRRRELPREFLTGLWRALADNRDFRSFLLARALMAFGGMAVAFYAVYAVDVVKAPERAVGVFTGFALAAQTVSSLFWGWLGDKRGYLLTALAAGVPKLLATALALLAPSYLSFVIVFVLTGLAFSGEWLSLLNLTIELCPQEDKTTHVSLATTLLAPASAAAPLLGGLIVAHFSYQVLFAASLAAQVCGLVALAVTVREPRTLRPAARLGLPRP